MKRSDFLGKCLILEDLFAQGNISFYMKMDATLRLFEELGMTMLSWEQVVQHTKYPLGISIENQGRYGWDKEEE